MSSCAGDCSCSVSCSLKRGQADSQPRCGQWKVERRLNCDKVCQCLFESQAQGSKGTENCVVWPAEVPRCYGSVFAWPERLLDWRMLVLATGCLFFLICWWQDIYQCWRASKKQDLNLFAHDQVRHFSHYKGCIKKIFFRVTVPI